MTKKEGNNNDCKNNCTECSCSNDSKTSPFKSGFSPENIQTYYQPKILHPEEKFFYHDSTANISIIFHPQPVGPTMFAAFMHEFGVIIHFAETPEGFRPTYQQYINYNPDKKIEDICNSISPEKSELVEDIPCPPQVQLLMASLYEIEDIIADVPPAESLASQDISIQ